LHSLAPAMLIRPLIEDLSEEQCRKLISHQPISLKAKYRAVLEAFFLSIGLLD
jgi:hypothetical protein